MKIHSHTKGFAPLGVFIFFALAFGVAVIGAGISVASPKPKYVFAEALHTFRDFFGNIAGKVSSDGLQEVAAIPLDSQPSSTPAAVSIPRRVAKSKSVAALAQLSTIVSPGPARNPAAETAKPKTPASTPAAAVKASAPTTKSTVIDAALAPGMSRPTLAPPKPPRFLNPGDSSEVASPAGPAATTCHYSTGQTPSHSKLILNEIAWMGSVTSSSDEWMELKNVSGNTLDISGWQLVDSGEQIHVTMPANTTVAPGGLLLFERTNDDTVPSISADYIYVGALGNTSDGIRLFDENCLLHDEATGNPWPAGDAAARRTMERASDLTWYTSTAANVGGILGTPKAENSPRGANDNSTSSNTTQTTTPAPDPTPAPPASSAAHSVISEVRYGVTSNMAHAFVELYNPADASVAMTGWSLKKKSSTGTESSLVSAARLEGKTIASHGYLLLVNDGGYTDAVTPDATWAASYALVKNNGVVLYDASGANVDELSWTEVPDGASVEHNAVQLAPNPQNSASAHAP